MNRDDVLSAIKEAMWTGIYTQWTSPTETESMTVPVTWNQVERFADIIEQRARKDEREACVKRFIDAMMSAQKFDDIVSRGADAIRDMQESGGGE